MSTYYAPGMVQNGNRTVTKQSSCSHRAYNPGVERNSKKHIIQCHITIGDIKQNKVGLENGK